MKAHRTQKKWNWKRVVALCSALALGVAGWRAQPAQAQPSAIGVVDEDKLFDGFRKYSEAIKSFDRRVESLDEQLKAREMMNETEGARFDTLIVKDSRNKADEDALQALVKTGLGRRLKLLTLSGKSNRTDADTAEVKTLQEIQSKNQTPIRTITDTLYNTMKKGQEQRDKTFTEQVASTIAQVAADRKLALVWRRRAVLWNAPSIDITDEVLKRLNKT